MNVQSPSQSEFAGLLSLKRELAEKGQTPSPELLSLIKAFRVRLEKTEGIFSEAAERRKAPRAYADLPDDHPLCDFILEQLQRFFVAVERVNIDTLTIDAKTAQESLIVVLATHKNDRLRIKDLCKRLTPRTILAIQDHREEDTVPLLQYGATEVLYLAEKSDPKEPIADTLHTLKSTLEISDEIA